MTGGLECLEREVGRERKAEEVGEEAGGNVEPDGKGEDGADTEDGVGLGDRGLSLEAVESLFTRVRLVANILSH